MLKWHRNTTDWFQNKIGISNYVMLWISYIKGLILGLLIYHFLIK